MLAPRDGFPAWAFGVWGLGGLLLGMLIGQVLFGATMLGIITAVVVWAGPLLYMWRYRERV